MSRPNTNQHLEDLWLQFMYAIMVPEATKAKTEGLVDDQVLALYEATVTDDIFYNYMLDTLATYRALPDALHHLQAELRNLALATGLDIPVVYELDNVSKIDDIEIENVTDFLRGTNWYTDMDNPTEVEIELGTEMINAIFLIAEMVLERNIPANTDSDLETVGDLWWRIVTAAEKKEARLIQDWLGDGSYLA